jgi:hypothetical protein
MKEKIDPEKVLNDFYSLPTQDRDGLVNHLIRLFPEEALTLVTNKKEEIHKHRSNTIKFAALAKKSGASIKLENGLEGTIFRLNNPQVSNVAQSYERFFKTRRSTYPNSHSHDLKDCYVVAVRVTEELVYLVCEHSTPISRVILRFAHMLNVALTCTELFVFEGKAFPRYSKGAELLKKALVEKLDPNIKLLLIA